MMLRCPRQNKGPIRHAEADTILSTMIGFLWRLMWAWRAWRAINRDGRVTRMVQKGWRLHANRWLPRSDATSTRTNPSRER